MRYFSFMVCIDNPHAEQKIVDKVSSPAKENGCPFRGFDLFLDNDYQLFLALIRG
uniref:Uncharacterized protein n=1 Tax=Candidatus Kentrum sp. SD TaxID=2126332 RepID=A0A450YKM8_9GAMM|nr:MAG: hypothetical protein BECKSD772F_GA0070984_11138 [Candidatus Kentron sp. SD]VFK47984.1 MAG: hypothetical protein BECKSD772E_GA0070983_11108 [Candidatus Kentron sp. SD]VFK80276.1 MAG: hypothetical protein BECKSD772D_GA0070982_10988 [Candidatus Kentron sp. SD]